MEPTRLIDGRLVNAEPCLNIEGALLGDKGIINPSFFEHKGHWFLSCRCCEGNGEHSWSPSGHGVDPNGGHYTCGPCAGANCFEIKMP